VTDADAMPVVRQVFRGENEALCRQIGPRARGLMGDELGLEADLLPGFGAVGILRPVVPRALRDVIAAGDVPVIAPLAQGPLNVNADDAAAVLAVALGAERIVFVSDVPGVLVDGAVVPEFSARDLVELDTELSGGILPKLEAALVAARGGVRAEVGATVVVA
jgi:acetylglutamate kinase